MPQGKKVSKFQNKDFSKYTVHELMGEMSKIGAKAEKADIDDKETFIQNIMDLKNIRKAYRNRDDYLVIQANTAFYNILNVVLSQTYLVSDLPKINDLLNDDKAQNIPEQINEMYNEFDKTHDKYDHYYDPGRVFKNNLRNIPSLEDSLNTINAYTEDAKTTPREDRNNPYRLKDLISTYRLAKEDHKNRSFFTKVAQFFTGNKENRALAKLEKAIRESTDIPKAQMDLAFKAPNEGKLGTILRYSAKDITGKDENEITDGTYMRPIQSQETTMQIEVSTKELGEEEVQLDRDELNPETSKEASIDGEELEEEEFSYEIE